MKKCTKPEMEIVMLDDKDILTESSCPDHICTIEACNLQGCPNNACEEYDWPEE